MAKQSHPESLLVKNGNNVPTKSPRLYNIQGSKLEAESLFISADFPESFDFPWNPDDLVTGNNYSIYDEMRIDDQIKAALSIKKDMVISTGWEIKCDDEEIRDFVTNNLNNIHRGTTLDSTFDDVLRDILSSYEYGFSLSEVIYKLDEQGLYIVKAIKVRPPHTFKFHINPQGDVEQIEQTGLTGPIMFNPDKFLHHVYQQEFGNPFGKSDLKSAFKHWKTKKFFFKMFAMHVERFANPTVIGTYPENADQAEVASFETLIKSLQNASTWAIPEGTKIEFVQPGRDASDVYIKGIDMLDIRIARSLLVPDLLGMSGSKTSGGSFSLGEKQFELFMDIIQKDRLSIEKKVSQRVVKPMVEANWGDVQCDFKFKPFSDENILEATGIWVDAVKGKVFKPNEDEINHLRSIVGFPQGNVEITEPVEASPGFGGFSQTPAMPEQLKDYREKSAFEKKVDFVSINNVLTASDREVKPELERTAKVIWQDLIDQVKSKGILTKFKPEKINDIKPRFLSSMNSVFKGHFRRLFRQAKRDADREFNKKNARKLVEDDIEPNEFEEIIDTDAFKSVGDYAVKMEGITKNVVLKGMKDGLSQSEIIKILKDELPDKTDVWLDTTIRTKTTEFYNAGRKTFWDSDPVASKFIEAFEYSAIIDSRTSDVCQFLDGKIFTKGELTNHITPPLHFNCRSLLVPVTRFEDFEGSKKFIPKSKQPSLESLRKKGGNLIVGNT